MSGFSADWLALREPADTRARDSSPVAPALSDWAARRAGAQQAPAPLRIVDLGSGSSANLRYLAPRLGQAQAWRLIEHDAALLAQAPRALRDWAQFHGFAIDAGGNDLYIASPTFAAAISWQPLDLAAQLDRLAWHETDLVTASALLDLVSCSWIESLIQHCDRARCAVLFALSYDGRTAWRPVLALDDEIRRLLNRHQRADKGFGPAAGPHAVVHASECLRDAGFLVHEGRSDWRLTPDDAALQAALATGWARAAAEMEPAHGARFAAWSQQRLAHIAREDSELNVGHVDLFGLPRPG